MLTQRERIDTLFKLCFSSILFGAALSILAAVADIGSEFYRISILFYGSGVFFGSVTLALLIINFTLIHLLEMIAARYMLVVGRYDQIIESRPVAAAIVRSTVVGPASQTIILAPDEGLAPHISRGPSLERHVAGELPVLEEMSDDAYRLFSGLLRRGSQEDTE